MLGWTVDAITVVWAVLATVFSEFLFEFLFELLLLHKMDHTVVVIGGSGSLLWSTALFVKRCIIGALGWS